MSGTIATGGPQLVWTNYIDRAAPAIIKSFPALTSLPKLSCVRCHFILHFTHPARLLSTAVDSLQLKRKRPSIPSQYPPYPPYPPRNRHCFDERCNCDQERGWQCESINCSSNMFSKLLHLIGIKLSKKETGWTASSICSAQCCLVFLVDLKLFQSRLNSKRPLKSLSQNVSLRESNLCSPFSPVTWDHRTGQPLDF